MTLPSGQIKTSADMLAMARAMAEHAAERYHELAEAFAMSCNPDTAEAFRELAATESRHAAEFTIPPSPAAMDLVHDAHAPEIADPDAVHYLMLPWHAFDLALHHQERTLALFDAVIQAAVTADLHDTAHALAEREKARIIETRSRRDALPTPAPGWWEDADEPNWDA